MVSWQVKIPDTQSSKIARYCSALFGARTACSAVKERAISCGGVDFSIAELDVTKDGAFSYQVAVRCARKHGIPHELDRMRQADRARFCLLSVIGSLPIAVAERYVRNKTYLFGLRSGHPKKRLST